jgi:hypothetical protein
MRLSAVPAGLITFVVAMAAACGGDNGGEGGGGGGQAQRALESDAIERAEDVVLQHYDFPDGWLITASDEEGAEEFRECTGVDYSALTIIGEAESAIFYDGTARAVSDAVVFDSAAEATAAHEELVGAMRSESLIECFKALVPEAIGEDFEAGDVEVSERSFKPPPGFHQAIAWQLAIEVEATSGANAGESATFYYDFVDLRAGDLLARVMTLDVQSPFDQELRDELVSAVAGHAIL